MKRRRKKSQEAADKAPTKAVRQAILAGLLALKPSGLIAKELGMSESAVSRHANSDEVQAALREAGAAAIERVLSLLEAKSESMLGKLEALSSSDDERIALDAVKLWLDRIQRLQPKTKVEHAGVVGVADLGKLGDEQLRELARRALRGEGEG